MMYPVSEIINNFGYLENNNGAPASPCNGNGNGNRHREPTGSAFGKLSAKLWLRIFGNLDRNDLEVCEHVSLTWKALIRSNTNGLPGRDIDFVLISSDRVFSLIISSGRLIKAYRMDKYYQPGTMPKSDNDAEHWLQVETYRRSPRKPPPTSPPTFEQFMEELVFFDGFNRSGRAQNCIKEYRRYNAIGTRHGMPAPSTEFFNKLDTLLQNYRSIRFFAFQDFTLTDEFIAKFAHIVRPIVGLEKLVLQDFQSEALPSRHDFFIKGLLAEKEEEKMEEE